MDSTQIILFCRRCQAPRYRSIRPIRKDEKLSPSLFQKCDEEGLEPVEGSPALCYLCQEACAPIADKKFIESLKTTSAPVRNTEQDVRQAQVEAPRALDTMAEQPHPGVAKAIEQKIAADTGINVELLFAPQLGEEIKAFKEVADGFVFITNQRVVKVKL